jgi:hypothetical protein
LPDYASASAAGQANAAFAADRSGRNVVVANTLQGIAGVASAAPGLLTAAVLYLEPISFPRGSWGGLTGISTYYPVRDRPGIVTLLRKGYRTI